MRRWLPVAVLAALTAVAIVAGALYAAAQDPPTMTEAEARTFARRAFASAGLDDAEVRSPVRRSYVERGEAEDVLVWVVPLEVEGERVELSVPVDGEQAVHLDDTAAEGGVVLDDQEFEAVDEFRLDLAGERERERRVVPAVVAALAAVGVAVLGLVALRTGRVSPPRLPPAARSS